MLAIRLTMWLLTVRRCVQAVAVRSLHRSVIALSATDNPYYDKYKDKLDKVLGAEGVLPKQTPPVSRAQRPSYSYTASPKLDSVLKVDLVLDKSGSEIASIWEEYHKTRDCVGCVMPSEQYVSMYTKASHCPLFVYPLPRGDGLEMVLAQFSGHKCYFTSLINYQMHAENAPVSLTLTHFTEFQESKGIVLMLGELEANNLSVLEAQYLANQVQLFYASDDVERYALVRQFNHDPQNFDYQKLIEQLNNAGI